MSPGVVMFIQVALSILTGALTILGSAIWMNYTLKDTAQERRTCVIVGFVMIALGFGIIYSYDSLNKAGKLGFMVPVVKDVVKPKPKVAEDVKKEEEKK